MSLAAALLLCLVPLASGRIHSLVIKEDSRFAFSIESFGFQDGGSVTLDIHDVSITPAGSDALMGFVVFPAMSEASVNERIDELIATGTCAMDPGRAPKGSLVINISDPVTWKDRKESAEVTGPGMFDILFTRCLPAGSDASVSFTIDAAFVNPGWGGELNYLSAGDMPLPAIYGTMTVAFFGALVAWLRYLRAHKAEATRVHQLMTILLVVKTLDVMFEAIMYHYIATTGHTTAWNVMFYIFSFVKGVLMAVVALLVGSGWNILKPFMSDREKKIMYVALALQLLTNMAIVMTDELAPGSISFLAWTDILHLADFIASAAVIIPIAWSMRSLQLSQGSGGDSDGKSAETLARLGLFRNFYMATIAYVYVTRFLLYILSSTLPYNATWFAPAADEVATLAYYVAVGYYFRPSASNAYLKVSGEDDEGAPAVGVATGAAAGTLEGAAAAVQTVSAARKPAHAIEDDVEGEFDDDELLEDEDEELGEGSAGVEKRRLLEGKAGAASGSAAAAAAAAAAKPVMKQVNKEGRT